MTPAVTAVILTYNEEANLRACLDSLIDWAAEIVVVDSGSTDQTLAIAAGARARILSRPFDTHARQWQWALAQLPSGADWVLGLDADQRITPELRAAITAAVARPRSPGTPSGYYLNRRQIFRGRWIRHGGYYPKYLLKLFRRDAVTIDERELVDHHFDVRGTTEILRGDLIEDNRNEARISDWVMKHNRYARLQALQETRERAGAVPLPVGFPLKRAWRALPLLVRPCLYFFYRYVIRLGFLDGREGFIFHVLQAFWYRLLVDINMLELADVPDAMSPARHEPGTVDNQQQDTR